MGYGFNSFNSEIASSAIFSPPPEATRLLTISYDPSANAFFVGTYAGQSFASSTTSVVLNGDACLIARPSSTKTSPGHVTQANRHNLNRHIAVRIPLRHIHNLVGLNLFEKRQIASANLRHLLLRLRDLTIRK